MCRQTVIRAKQLLLILDYIAGWMLNATWPQHCLAVLEHMSAREQPGRRNSTSRLSTLAKPSRTGRAHRHDPLHHPVLLLTEQEGSHWLCVACNKRSTSATMAQRQGRLLQSMGAATCSLYAAAHNSS